MKASDNGKPPLEDVCTIAVKIKDKNDNSPIFDRASYDVPVAQVRKAVEYLTDILGCELIKGFPWIPVRRLKFFVTFCQIMSRIIFSGTD